MSEWISVEDRLPESTDDVRVKTNDNCECMAWHDSTDWWESSTGLLVDDDIDGSYVTHWMPLLEAL